MKNSRVLVEGIGLEELIQNITEAGSDSLREIIQSILENNSQPRYYTTEEFGKITHQHPVTVRRKVQKGIIQGKKYARKILIPASEVERVLKPLS